MKSSGEAADYGELLAWAASLGVTDAPLLSPSTTRSAEESASSSCLGRSLCIANFPAAGGRGLAAVRDLKEGELVLRVPDVALMSCKTAREDPKLKQILDLFPTLSSSQVLSIHLLNEIAKGSASQWYVYLQNLPRTHYTLSHFSSFEAEELQDGDAIWTAKRACQKAYADWEAARPVIAKLGLSSRFTKFKAWLWATATVSSRSLHVPWDEAGALCPIGDFFNYAPPGQCCDTLDSLRDQNIFDARQQTSLPLIKQCFYDENESGFGLFYRGRLRDGGYDANLGAYCFYARRDYEKGQQVLLSYGQYTNLELLEYYGFLLPHNPNNMLYLSPPDGTEFGHANLDSNFQEQVVSNGFYITSDGIPSFSLLAALRLSAASPSLRKSHGYRALAGMQLSIEVDLVVYEWLSKKCQSLLESFPTTIQEDNILLEILSTCGDSKGECVFSDLSRELCEGRKTLGDVVACPMMRRLGETMDAGVFTKASSHAIKIGNLIDKYKAALQWRLTHKAILEHCIQHSKHKLLLLGKGL